MLNYWKILYNKFLTVVTAAAIFDEWRRVVICAQKMISLSWELRRISANQRELTSIRDRDDRESCANFRICQYFSRLMREYLCKICLREKFLKRRKISLCASFKHSLWASYSTCNLHSLMYLWLFFLLS
jgi:hypothetical protein